MLESRGVVRDRRRYSTRPTRSVLEEALMPGRRLQRLFTVAVAQRLREDLLALDAESSTNVVSSATGRSMFRVRGTAPWLPDARRAGRRRRP